MITNYVNEKRQQAMVLHICHTLLYNSIAIDENNLFEIISYPKAAICVRVSLPKDEHYQVIEINDVRVYSMCRTIKLVKVRSQFD